MSNVEQIGQNSETTSITQIDPEILPPNDAISAQEPETFIDKHGCKRYKANGRLCKGSKCNPLGAPPKRFVSSQLKRLLELGDDKKIAKRLMKIALNSANERNATYASEVIMDRTEGKPVAFQVNATVLDESQMDRMADLAERLEKLAGK